MADFTGFTINGVHSSDLGITRIADGDRYDDTLLPDMEDKVVEIPGNDGSYYYGSYYKPKQFKVNIAFDHLTETQLRRVRQLVGDKKPFPLIFDEAPYKKYMVKAIAPPELHYICFDEEIKDYEGKNLGVAALLDDYKNNGDHDPYPNEVSQAEQSLLNDLPETISYRRIYKGEGDLNLIAYKPFAYAPYKTLTEYENYCDNVDEWAEASGMLTSLATGDYDIYTKNNSVYKINVYNPGDINTPFQLYIPFNGNNISSFTIVLKRKTLLGALVEVEGAHLGLMDLSKVSNEDDGIMINTENHLIEGVKKVNSSYLTTGTIYNQYISGGNFFQINCDSAPGAFDGAIVMNRNLEVGENNSPTIMYKYIYY